MDANTQPASRHVKWINVPQPWSTSAKINFFLAEKTLVKALTQDFRLQISDKSLNRHNAILLPIGLTDILIRAEPAFVPSELTDLITELDAGKYKVGYFRKFFIRLKTLFSGDYDITIAKLAFSKITNKSIFLRIAFDYISLSTNKATSKKNMEFLAKLQTNLPS
ncbi:MAG: hypothetical protein LBC30_00125 [Puniceicoccales bacterium]|jgi:hypothetical protein|nr:hypothetical protein [Puniceicoccales bacterium]